MPLRLLKNCTVLLLFLVSFTVHSPCLGVPAHKSVRSVDLLTGSPWILTAPSGNTSTLDVVGKAGLPGQAKSELVAHIAQATSPLYLIQAKADIADIGVGHRVCFRFWGRAEGSNAVRVVVETVDSPWIAVCDSTITLTPSWAPYTVYGSMDRDLGQKMAAKLQIGASTGTIEFAALHVVDEGPSPGALQSREATVDKVVQARIRRYRTGRLSIRIVDASEHPVRNAKISIHETRSAFLFGCNLIPLDLTDSSASQLAYRSRFTALFNYATLPVYWSDFERVESQPNYEKLDSSIDWCAAHGIAPKLHPLVWNMAYPAWAPSDPETVIPLLRNRVTDIVTRERNRVRYFDVVNEASNAASYAPPNGESLWVKRDGAAKVVETALGWAKAARRQSPDTLIYNDYETGMPNVNLLTALQTDGQLPNAIGIQSHMHMGAWPLENVWGTCQKFGKFHRPIHFTEITVLSGSTRTPDFAGPPATDWNTTPAGEKAQADYTAKLYSLLFSNPSVQAITWWDLSDLHAWLGAPAGLIRKDMTPKPAYSRLFQLIRHDWWTNLAGASGADGVYSGQAFFGNYDVTVDDRHGHHQSTSISFLKTSRPVTLRMP